MATKAPIDKLKIGRKVKAVRNGKDYGVGKIIDIKERDNGRWYVVLPADKLKGDITVRGPSLTPV